MSKIQKTQMLVDGNKVNMSMSFSKVDKENRLVSGFATLNNVDTQDDVVSPEASRKAFSRARGNIREMHENIAAGRMVDFREDEYFDKESGNFYQGIYATAYISKGAQSTWEKVLDGTLSGFSIGGEIKSSTNKFDKSIGKTVRYIEDYDLTELSLVDNPANPLANVKSFTKVFSMNKDEHGETIMKGIATETTLENVFVCSADQTVTAKDSESEDCPVCGIAMENAGWFESAGDRTEKVQSIVTKFLAPAEEASPISREEEGGEVMSKKEKEEVKVEEKPVVAEEEKNDEGIEEGIVDETAGTEEEGSEAPEEVHDEESTISKKIDELRDAVTTTIEESKTETLKRVKDLEKKIGESEENFMAKAGELESKMDEFKDKFETTKARLAQLETSLEKMNSADAFRKSAGLETGPAEKIVQKDTKWNGAFSVDNLV